MASMKERTCNTCGKVELTFSKVSNCAACANVFKHQAMIANDKQTLESFGYKKSTYISTDKNKKKTYSVITPCCGDTQQMLFNNMVTMFKKRGKPACQKCGGIERVGKALAGYMNLYARNYDISLFEDYAVQVRRITDNTYNKYKDIINPLDLPRTANGWHVDHKMSVRDCFVHSIKPELAGSLINLVMQTAHINVTKGKKSNFDLRDWVDADLSHMPPQEQYDLGIEYTKEEAVLLPEPEVVAEHIQEYLDNIGDATIDYLNNKKEQTVQTQIQILLNYGFTAIFEGDIDNFGRRFYKVTDKAGNTKVVLWQKLLTLMKNNLQLWSEGTYEDHVKHLKHLKRFEDTEESRANRRAGQLRANALNPRTPEKHKAIGAKKIGYKRWYHPDFPSFKQAKECPGDGWTTEKPEKMV